jgi:hypothetical protein
MFKHYINSSFPARIILIIDQSNVMNEPYYNGKTKAEYVVQKINRLINELIFRCCAGDKIKDWFHLTIIGHSNNEAYVLKSNYLSSFSEEPLRIDKTRKLVSDGARGFVEVEKESCIWIEPKSIGLENLFDSFKMVKEILINFSTQKEYLSCLVININGGFCSSWRDLSILIEEIKRINMNNENIFLFNWYLSAKARKLEFTGLDMIYKEDFNTQFYFNLSSFITDEMIENVRKFDFNLKKGSKLFSQNGINNILNFINLGS